MVSCAKCFCQSCKVFCKFIQLVMIVICIGLHVGSYYAQSDLILLLLSCTYGVFFVILVGDIAASCVAKSMPKPMEMLYRLCGVTLFFACGCLSLKFYMSQFIHLKLIFFTSTNSPIFVTNCGIFKGIFSLVTSATFLISLISSCVTSDKNPAQNTVNRPFLSYDMLTCSLIFHHQ